MIHVHRHRMLPFSCMCLCVIYLITMNNAFNVTTLLNVNIQIYTNIWFEISKDLCISIY